ncbi:MAG TPA: leucyl aminopeptidase family protein [Saprospiraceae bacterium]|nr:leucyl aminopeptidase family protein [Saprospiraceae bacterium]HND89440.1 leucyl aminopeptidase family protein [Saprospiraceae bacterium]
MQRVQLVVEAAAPTADNWVILAEKDGLTRLAEWLEAAECAFVQQAAARDVQQFCFPRAERLVFVRLLKPEKNPSLAAESARAAGNDLLRELRQYKLETLTLFNACSANRALPFAEGLALGSYQFFKYFTQPDKKDKPLRSIAFGPDVASEGEVAALDALVESVFLTRDWVNEPHSHFSAVHLGEQVEAAAAEYGFCAEVLGEEALESLRMGGLLAVNRASSVPPRFCILEWKPPAARNARPLVLVGKGVVYDTGGLSIKSSEGMEYMKCDMAGAAVVAAVFALAARLRWPLHLVGIIPATDNKIGEKAIGPGDVITMHSGTTVEVVNTDAEGRLILADALHFAKKYEPELVLDFATLTGAAIKALGNQAIAYMGTAAREIKQAFEESGHATYERLVELPLWKEYGDELKSPIADLRNVGSSNGGMMTAGKFLEHFVGDLPWLHFDIAGPAYLRTANGYRPKEGTGVGVRLVAEFLRRRYLSE